MPFPLLQLLEVPDEDGLSWTEEDTPCPVECVLEIYDESELQVRRVPTRGATATPCSCISVRVLTADLTLTAIVPSHPYLRMSCPLYLPVHW
jgi:hypothetical protein